MRLNEVKMTKSVHSIENRFPCCYVTIPTEGERYTFADYTERTQHIMPEGVMQVPTQHEVDVLCEKMGYSVVGYFVRIRDIREYLVEEYMVNMKGLEKPLEITFSLDEGLFSVYEL